MMRAADGDLDVEAWRQVDRATQALVPACEPGTLPTDPKHLDAMFVFATNNWRTHHGEKPTGNKLARINAIHKQATSGDCTDTEWSTPFERTVLRMWHSYRGTPAIMAKRRFLALLMDVDPRLLEIKAYQFSPWGFPTTAKGERICPYSNTKKGCPRPLMDKYGHNLEQELDTNESLSEFATLKTWLDEVVAQQRCALGLHTPISAEQGSKFSTFFARPECGGFRQHTSAKIHNMVNKVLTKQFLALLDMQKNPLNFSKIAHIRQRDRVSGLQQYYTSLTGHEFSNEVPCSRDSHHCDTRRLAEGSNHTHPVIIRTPPTDLSLYDPLIQVRRECVRLGVVPATGPVHSIDHRCRLLQMKVADFHRKQMLIYESQRRQQWRIDIAPHDAALLKTFSHHHRSEHLRHALDAKDMDRVCVLLESGADPSTELRSGLFPMMAAVLKRSIPVIQRLLASGADINHGNSKGMTALMWAVKRNDYAMVDALLEERADVEVEGCSGWTAMSIASRHGRRDIAQFLVETLRADKIVGDMKATRALNHRSSVNRGLTPLAIAAIHRNEAMARCLMRLGAKPAVKCHQGHVAGEHAAKAGWSVFGLWLQETQAFGDRGVYTFADMNAENTLRVAEQRMLDAISSGETVEDDSKRNSRTASVASNSGGSRTGPAMASSSSRQVSSAISGDTRLLSSASGGRRPTSSREQSEPRPMSAISAKATEEENNQTLPEPLPEVLSESARDGGLSGFLDVTQFQLGQIRSKILLTVSILHEGRAAPDTESDSGHTALISAVYRGQSSSVRSLIQEGADPNYSNRNGRTALMAAAAAGDPKMVIILLRHKADAARTDIHGKVAGAYAFERGFADLAQLLAIAAADGHEAAVDWELDRSRREEEDKERQRVQHLMDRQGGVGGDGVPEANLYDWMIRVTKPREAARIADRKLQSEQGSFDQAEPSKHNNNSVSPLRRQQKGRERCPKCTLFIPCLHFAGAKLPDGVAEWSVNQRGASRRANAGGKRLVHERSGNQSVAWWGNLHQAHRDRTLPPRPVERSHSSTPPVAG
ncbi:unnamed protein product [Ectocarpus sp. 4 AP-2014]